MYINEPDENTQEDKDELDFELSDEFWWNIITHNQEDDFDYNEYYEPTDEDNDKC